jgi:uncharacterized membrane protein
MTPYEWSPPHIAVVYLALGLGLIVLLLLACRFARSSTARSWPLLLVRAAVLAVLLVLLSNPVRITETRLPPRTPEVTYLIDCSRSMALDRPTSRLEQVKQTLARGTRALPKNTGPRISLYRFGNELVACASPNELRAEDDATRLLDALERLPSRFGDETPGGVVVFSDGRTTETTGFDAIAAAYRRLGVPVHVFPVGDPAASADVAIQDVIAPRDALPGSRVPVRVLLRSHGYEGRRTEVRIRSLADPNRKPLAVLPITLGEGQKGHDLVFEHDPAAGKLVVEVPPFEGEAIVDNNRVAFQIGARKPKIRVLYMEGTVVPEDEYHYVRDALIEDPNIECVAVVVDNQYVAQPTLHRIGDPGRGYPTTREELFTYDVIICSDIDRHAFTRQQLDWTVELVGKRGGGFAMVGGNTSFGAGHWDQTVWDELIPVDMAGQADDPGRGFANGQAFRVTVPSEAERHPIWRIVDDPMRNRQILEQMPPFNGTNLIARLKPAATPLGYTDRPMPRVGVMPVFSCEPFGKGRTFAMSTDTTRDWGLRFENEWGEEGDNRYFRKWWRNVVLWLAENAPGVNRRLRVETDKMLYRPGQPITLSARAYDDKLEETNRYRLVARLRPPEEAKTRPVAPIQEAALAPKSSDRLYEGQLSAPPLRLLPTTGANAASPMRMAALDVMAYDGDREVSQTTLDVQVLDDPAEFQDPRPDAARLEELARASGGKVLHSAEELAQLLGTFTTAPGEIVVSRSPLWDHVGLWGLLVVLLTVEWVLRRWWGLA